MRNGRAFKRFSRRTSAYNVIAVLFTRGGRVRIVVVFPLARRVWTRTTVYVFRRRFTYRPCCWERIAGRAYNRPGVSTKSAGPPTLVVREKTFRLPLPYARYGSRVAYVRYGASVTERPERRNPKGPGNGQSSDGPPRTKFLSGSPAPVRMVEIHLSVR